MQVSRARPPLAKQFGDRDRDLDRLADLHRDAEVEHLRRVESVGPGNRVLCEQSCQRLPRPQ
jgi:hypothetical protein